MKHIIMKMTIIAVILSLALTACSTNTDQNTAVGAGTGAVVGGLLGTIAKGAGSGWVIAAGVVVGALIGGVIGHSVDSSDNNNMNMVMEKNPAGDSYVWHNENTGAYYTIVPTTQLMTYKGNPNCRHYVAYGRLHGKSTKTKGIACRLEDGNWQQVN
jgi:surface antigen